MCGSCGGKSLRFASVKERSVHSRVNLKERWVRSTGPRGGEGCAEDGGVVEGVEGGKSEVRFEEVDAEDVEDEVEAVGVWVIVFVAGGFGGALVASDVDVVLEEEAEEELEKGLMLRRKVQRFLD